MQSNSNKYLTLLQHICIYNNHTFVPTIIEMKIENHIKSNKTLSLHKKMLINVLYTGNWLNDSISEVLKDFDISTQQFNVLRILKGRNGNPANLSDIQERMIAKNSNTTRLVDKLINKELVSKKKCPSNKRKVEILITASGLIFLDQVNEVVENREANIIKHLNEEEIEQLNALLNKLRN